MRAIALRSGVYSSRARRISFNFAPVRLSVFDFAYSVRRTRSSCDANVVDDSHATGLARTSPAPAHLPYTARTGNHISGHGALRDECGELTPLLLTPVKRPLLLKEKGLDDREHHDLYA
jgi:hypothetical protein